MPEFQFVPFNPKPGVHRQSTRYAEKGTWYDSDKIRFRNNLPEKTGGWVKVTSQQFEGLARDLLTFQDLNALKYIAFGTQCFLYAENGGTIYDITPLSASTSITNSLNTTLNSLIVVVSSPAHGREAGDHVVFTSMAATIGGNVFLSGTYDITVVGPDSYSILNSVSAAATSLSTGDVRENFLIHCGTTSPDPGYGWGVGTWGTSAWGTPRSMSTVVINERQWSLSNWGQDLVANPRGGAIYLWNTSAGPSTRAAIITAAPSTNAFVFVSDQDRHMVTLGTNDMITSLYNPLLVRWCSTDNYNDWNASITNTAGDKLIDSGTFLVGGLRSKTQNLLWTDKSLYGMTYIGGQFVFDFDLLGTNCGLIAPHAAIDVDGKTYWSSQDNFYAYDGSVRVLNCTVLKYYLNTLMYSQRDKIYCGLNSEFQEIYWFYPTLEDGEPDHYIKYNFQDDLWDIGTLDRSTWRAKNIFENPIATGNDSYLYYHEPQDVYDGDGQAIDSYIKSAPMEIGNGDEIVFVDKIIPDFDVSGTVNMTFEMQKYPAAVTVTKGPYTVSAGTTKINIRARARQGSIRVGSSAVGERWSMGVPRISIRPDGEQ